MTISNSALALQLQSVATGWREFVEQQISWLIDEVDTITVQDPYNASITRTVKTIWKIQQDYEALFEPASGALGQITELLSDAQELVDELNELETTFSGYNTDFITYRDQAQAAATQAQVHRDAAELAETHAETAETNAEAAATASSASETAAAASASAANTSALAAAASAAAAEASADAAEAAAAVFVPGVTVNGNATKATEITFEGTAVQSVVQTGLGVVVTLVGGGGSGLTDGNKGDITVSSGGSVWTINVGAVTSSRLGGDISAVTRSLVTQSTASAWRGTLGLGSAATASTGDFAATVHSHNVATTGADGFMSAADKTKLNSIAPSATANSPDSILLNRANHTGTQAASTITGLSPVATSGSASDISSGLLSAPRMGTGTADSTTVLHGDRVWRIPASASIQMANDGGSYTPVTRIVADANPPVSSFFSPVQLSVEFSGSDAVLQARIFDGTLSWNALASMAPKTLLGNPDGSAYAPPYEISAPNGDYVLLADTSGFNFQKLTPAYCNVGGSLTGKNGWFFTYHAAENRFELVPAPSGGGMPPNGTYGDIGVSGSVWTIQTDAITGPELAANSVSTAKISNDAVTVAKVFASGSRIPAADPYGLVNKAALTGDGVWTQVGALNQPQIWKDGQSVIINVNSATRVGGGWGWAALVERTSGTEGLLSLGGYATINGGIGTSAFGIATEVVCKAGNGNLIGSEFAVADFTSNRGIYATVASYLVFKNRADGAATAHSGIGSNRYNIGAVALMIDSQERSASGEYCGFERGIVFRRNGLDRSFNLTKAVGIDFYGDGSTNPETGRVDPTRVDCIRFPDGTVQNTAFIPNAASIIDGGTAA